MIKKATAKSAEANAAVRRRAAGLDQRLRMSASVAGLPSIYAATACLPELFCRSVGAREEHLYSDCTATNHTRLKSPSRRFELEDLCGAGLLQLAVARLGCLHRVEALRAKIAASGM